MECNGKCLCSREGVSCSCSNKLLEAVVVHHPCNDRMTGDWCQKKGIYNLHFESFSNVHHFIRYNKDKNSLN